MSFGDRINAVLHLQKPDRVPFTPYDNLVPRGDFSRELRNRGMGLCLRRSTIWSECPNVRVETRTEGEITITTYHTPEGDVSTRRRTHLGRIDDSSGVQLDGMIKRVEDFAPVIFMIEDMVFHADNSLYFDSARDVGQDGIVCEWAGVASPYDATRQYFGLYYGLANWVYAQQDHPRHFTRLLEALTTREERRLSLVAHSPAEVISLGSLDGHYGPGQFRALVLPFYQKYVPLLQAQGKICTLHAHASNLTVFQELIAQTGVDVVEAFTPPPVGDLTIAEARAAWGPDTIIWVNFPETMFWHGADRTKEYTLDLLRSDPRPDRLVIGMTEMGTYGVTDDESEGVFKTGMRAIMDAIDEYT